ncbi:hypothetical protein BH10BAC2_BH10BAC2_46280 [soil metagenome]
METRRQSDALPLIPFMNEFSKEQLTLKSPDAAKKYNLKIDGKPVVPFTGLAFADGVNLAAIIITPQYKQALSLMYLNEERWEIERRFRMYYWLQFSFFRDKGLLFADNKPHTIKFGFVIKKATMVQLNRAAINEIKLQQPGNSISLSILPKAFVTIKLHAGK